MPLANTENHVVKIANAWVRRTRQRMWVDVSRIGYGFARNDRHKAKISTTGMRYVRYVSSSGSEVFPPLYRPFAFGERGHESDAEVALAARPER